MHTTYMYEVHVPISLSSKVMAKVKVSFSDTKKHRRAKPLRCPVRSKVKLYLPWLEEACTSSSLYYRDAGTRCINVKGQVVRNLAGDSLCFLFTLLPCCLGKVGIGQRSRSTYPGWRQLVLPLHFTTRLLG